MSQLTNIPKQSYFSAQLQSPITAGQTADITLTQVPSYTPSGETVRFNILDPGGVETITATGWNPTTKVLTGVTRAIATYDGETATAYPHGAGITVVLSDDWKYFEDIATAVNSKIDTAGGTFTGPVAFSGASTTLRIPNLTEVQRDALVSPQNGLILYNTTAGEFQYYDGGAWLTVGTASVPNASETVAGIIELATASQSGSATSTGETGARLVMPNSLNVTTSAGAGDAGKNPVLNASGVLDPTIVNAATTGNSNVVLAKSDGELDDSRLGLTTAGDIVYSDGTNLERLAIGSANQRLSVNSGATAPSWVTFGKISASAANVNVIGTGTFATVSIPANTLGTYNFLRITSRYIYENNGTTYTATFRILYGGTVIYSSSQTNTSGNTRPGYVDINLIANGFTNSQESVGFTITNSSSIAIVMVTGIAIDSTIAQNLVFDVVQDSVNTSTVTLTSYTIEAAT